MASAYARTQNFVHPETTLGITDKMMNVVVGVWEINDKSGNWIKGITPTGQPQPKPKIDDEIPF